MFFLRDLPTYQALENIGRQYKELDPSAMLACIVLMRTGSDMLAALEKILKPYGLSQGGYLTLVVLNRSTAEDITTSELAGRVGVTRATMTGILDTLAKDKLIERIPHAADRRSLVVRLTEQGVNRLNRIFPNLFRQIAEVAADLSKKEREELIRLLLKINKGLTGKKA